VVYEDAQDGYDYKKEGIASCHSTTGKEKELNIQLHKEGKYVPIIRSIKSI
jgi:alpha-glucosidase